jgi:hypothetical protein
MLIFAGDEIRGTRLRVNIRLLTRASTPEQARSSASESERSQHILNPKVASSNPTSAMRAGFSSPLVARDE